MKKKSQRKRSQPKGRDRKSHAAFNIGLRRVQEIERKRKGTGIYQPGYSIKP